MSEERPFARAGHAGDEAVEQQIVKRDDELRDVGQDDEWRDAETAAESE